MPESTAAPRPYHAFWGEMAPCDHIVQIYEDDDGLIDALEGFVGGALEGSEAAIVIATPQHRQALDRRLQARGLDLDAARGADRYIALDADETLQRFMRNHWPDDERFEAVVLELLQRAGRGGRRVRAFGEMVALLWAKGYHGATVRLEHLWAQVCRRRGLALFCSYPRAGFTTRDSVVSINQICAAHSRLFPG